MTPESFFLFYMLDINAVYIQPVLAPQQNPRPNFQHLMLLSNLKFQVFRTYLGGILRSSTLFLNFLGSLYMSFYKVAFFCCSREFPQSHALFDCLFVCFIILSPTHPAHTVLSSCPHLFFSSFRQAELL